MAKRVFLIALLSTLLSSVSAQAVDKDLKQASVRILEQVVRTRQVVSDPRTNSDFEQHCLAIDELRESAKFMLELYRSRARRDTWVQTPEAIQDSISDLLITMSSTSGYCTITPPRPRGVPHAARQAIVVGYHDQLSLYSALRGIEREAKLIDEYAEVAFSKGTPGL